MIRSVAILGGGPAASTLGILLARRGCRVVLWHRPPRVPLIVGESLVPAVVPILKELGVEQRIREFSTYKPGATFVLTQEDRFDFFFNQLQGSMPPYAFNVPRDRFDETLLAAAQRAGAHVIEQPACVEVVPGTDRVRLTESSLDTANQILGGPPDYIVDATGRARLLPQLLELPYRQGPRKDTALFAHMDRAEIEFEGHVQATRLKNGWSWQIPLPGCVSLGMVIGSEFLPNYGNSKEERFDNLTKQESALQAVVPKAKRITPVLEYTNYQLVSTRTVGPGWALVGDTAGFIDPIFSSGLFIGMQSAVSLAKAMSDDRPIAFARYEREVIHHLKTWHEIVDYFYDGRLFTCFKVGQMLRDTLLARLTFDHLNKQFGRIFSGAASTSPYGMALLRFAMKYGLKNEHPSALMIH